RRKRRRLQARRLHQDAWDFDERLLLNLLDMSTYWQAVAASEGVYEGRNRKTNAVKWTGTRVDLIFGSHSQLRASRRSMPARTRRGSSSDRTRMRDLCY